MTSASLDARKSIPEDDQRLPLLGGLSILRGPVPGNRTAGQTGGSGNLEGAS